MYVTIKLEYIDTLFTAFYFRSRSKLIWSTTTHENTKKITKKKILVLNYHYSYVLVGHL